MACAPKKSKCPGCGCEVVFGYPVLLGVWVRTCPKCGDAVDEDYVRIAEVE